MAWVLGPGLVLAGFGLYMATNTLLGRVRRVPLEFLAVSALGPVAAGGIALRSGGASNVAAPA